MSWNYRIIKKTYATSSDESEEIYAIHEAYDADSGNPPSWTLDPCPVTAESVEGLRWVLEKMLLALDKPVIEDS